MNLADQIPQAAAEGQLDAHGLQPQVRVVVRVFRVSVPTRQKFELRRRLAHWQLDDGPCRSGVTTASPNKSSRSASPATAIRSYGSWRQGRIKKNNQPASSATATAISDDSISSPAAIGRDTSGVG